MKFFCDVCFPKRLCAVLACIDGKQFHFDHHSDQFAQDTDDVTWLWAVGSWIDRPVVISGDNRILKKRDEMQELMEQDLMFVCMYEAGNFRLYHYPNPQPRLDEPASLTP